MRLLDAIKEVGQPYYIPDCSRDNLPELFKELGFKTGAEIGVSWGENMEKYLQTGFMMYGIDPYLDYADHHYRPLGALVKRHIKCDTMDDVYDFAMNRLKDYPNFAMIRKTSIDALNDIPNRSLDFVYIDGNHLYGYVAMDLMQWAQKVRRGGIISGHDYYHPKGSRSCRGIAPAVDGFVISHDIPNYWILGSKRVLKKHEIATDERLDDHLSFMMFKHW